ncbi:MAG: anaerobic ribonucleoside-triphosphate reductase activating protein [Candidatus Aenigmatarchaeota archaeon]
MIIKGYIPTTLIDYPGKIASIVFLPRCNFRCPYCYNVELVNDSEELEIISEDEIFEHLKLNKDWIEGVVLTGGEPCIHQDLPAFIKKIKELGFLVKLDTNGTNPKMLKELIEEKTIDYIAMDIKAPLEKYEDVARVKVNKEDIKKSIDIIRSSGIDYEFRTTVLPTLLKKRDMEKIGVWLKGSKKFFIQQFRPGKTLDKKFQNEKPYSLEDLDEFREILKKFIENVEIRGT